MDNIVQKGSYKNKVAGIVRDWYDDDDSIPIELKNKDGQVINEEGEPLEEYKIFNNTSLKPGIYRTYKFLTDHGNLQKTYYVETCYN